MEFDTGFARRLRDTLVELSPKSLPPQYGDRRALEASPEEDAIVERFLPFGELILLVARADGIVGEAEEKAVTGAFVALTGGRVSRSLLEKIRAESEKRLVRSGVMERLEVLCAELAMNAEDAELAFALASAVAFADDRLPSEERDLLGEIAMMLRLSRSTAFRIRDASGPESLR